MLAVVLHLGNLKLVKGKDPLYTLNSGRPEPQPTEEEIAMKDKLTKGILYIIYYYIIYNIYNIYHNKLDIIYYIFTPSHN